MTGSQSLERGLQVLELLDKAPEPLGVREMSRSVGLSPTIVQRLVNTLAQHGYIHQDAVLKKYMISYKAFGLGWRLTRDDRLISASIRELQELATKHLLNAYLAILRGNRAVYLLAFQSEGPVGIRSVPGSEAFLHSTAMGKVLLATIPSAQARKLLTSEPLKRLTEKTETNANRIMTELEQIRKKEVAIVRGENIPGVTSIGVPIRDFSGKVVASVSTAYSDNFFSAADQKDVISLTINVGKRISESLGYQ